MPQPDDLNEEERDLLGIAEPTEEEVDAEEKQKLRAQHRRDMIAYLMESDLFREWWMEMLVGFGAFENAFGAAPNGFPSREATQFKLGMKAAGWYMWEQVDNIVPEKASLMRREQAGRDQLAERRPRRGMQP